MKQSSKQDSIEGHKFEFECFCFPSLDPLWFPLPAQPSAARFHLFLTSPGLSLFGSLPLWSNAILQDGRSEAADMRVSTSTAPANVRLLYEIYTSNPTHASHHTSSATFRAFPEQLMEVKMRLCTFFECCSTTPPPGGRRGLCLSSALIKLT